VTKRYRSRELLSREQDKHYPFSSHQLFSSVMELLKSFPPNSFVSPVRIGRIEYKNVL
jgi:hypothetical protein